MYEDFRASRERLARELEQQEKQRQLLQQQLMGSVDPGAGRDQRSNPVEPQTTPPEAVRVPPMSQVRLGKRVCMK